MSRRKRKRKPRRRPIEKGVTPTTSSPKSGKTARLLGFLVGSGLLLVAISGTYQYLAGNVSLEFLQSVGRAYEFQLRNDTPSDKTVVSFRVDPPLNQRVVYKKTKDVYARRDEKGQTILPESMNIYVPAAEFNELDGQVLDANSSIKFRIPPLSSSSLMEPEATIVDLRFKIESHNPLLQLVERPVEVLGLRSKEQSMRFLVIDNYWTPSNAASLDEAIRVYCRENTGIATSLDC